MRRSAGFKYMTPSQVNIPSTHKLTILHLQPELITAFFLRHTSARGERVHGSLIPPPSLWPGRELHKYHCPQHLSSPPPGAARLLSCKLYRSLISEVVAHSRKRLRGSAHSVGNVPDAWIFSFQGSLSLAALRKLNLRIPCGEICPLTFQWTFFCPLSGITQNIFLLFCGSARLRHARFAWSCRAPQHMRTGFSPR